MPKAKYRNIIERNSRGFFCYQVRVALNKKIYQKCFKFKTKTEKKSALKSAIAYREKLYKKLKIGANRINRRHYLDSGTHKNSTSTKGVHRNIVKDHRLSSGVKKSVTYVTWWRDIWYLGTNDNPKTRKKTFTLGAIERVTAHDEIVAFAAAHKFRKYWEHCIRYNKPFNPNKFKNWKNDLIR